MQRFFCSVGAFFCVWLLAGGGQVQKLCMNLRQKD